MDANYSTGQPFIQVNICQIWRSFKNSQEPYWYEVTAPLTFDIWPSIFNQIVLDSKWIFVPNVKKCPHSVPDIASGHSSPSCKENSISFVLILSVFDLTQSCRQCLIFLKLILLNSVNQKIFKHTDSYWTTLFISDYTATNSPCKKHCKAVQNVISSRLILPLLSNYKKLQCCFSIVFYCARTHLHTHSCQQLYNSAGCCYYFCYLYSKSMEQQQGAPQERWMLYTHW